MVSIQSQENLDAAFTRDISLLGQKLQQEQQVANASLEEMRRQREQQSLDIFRAALRSEVPEHAFSALEISVQETPLNKVQKDDPFFPFPLPNAKFMYRNIPWTIKMVLRPTSYPPADGLPWQWHISYVTPDGYGGSRTTNVDPLPRSWLLWQQLCYHVGMWEEKDARAREEARLREEQAEQTRAIMAREAVAKEKQDEQERAARQQWWEDILAEDKRLRAVVEQRQAQGQSQLWSWPAEIKVQLTRMLYYTWVPGDDMEGGTSVEQSGWVLSDTPDGDGFYHLLPTNAAPAQAVKPPYPPTFLRRSYSRTDDLPSELRTSKWLPCADILEVHYYGDIDHGRLCCGDAFDRDDPQVDSTDPYRIPLGEVPISWVQRYVDEAAGRQGDD